MVVSGSRIIGVDGALLEEISTEIIKQFSINYYSIQKLEILCKITLSNAVFLPDIPESESVSRCFSSLGTGVDGAGPIIFF